jgi:hypothetical protein
MSAADDTGMDFEAEDAVPDELIVPPELAHKGKYTTAYAAIKGSTFWSQLEQYVQLNELVAESSPILGGDLAAVSDATVAMLQLNDSVLTSTEFFESSYPALLDAVDISSIQKLWKGRFESFLRDVHFLALLLDPRAHIRAFVQQQPSILGSNDMPVANLGNTQAINATIDALHRWAHQCVSDDQPYVKSRLNVVT